MGSGRQPAFDFRPPRCFYGFQAYWHLLSFYLFLPKIILSISLACRLDTRLVRSRCRMGRGDSRNPSSPPPPIDGFRCALLILRGLPPPDDGFRFALPILQR